MFNGLLHVNYIVSIITCLLVLTAALIVSPVSNPTPLTSFYVNNAVSIEPDVVKEQALGGVKAGTSTGKIPTTEGKEFFIFSLCTVLGAIFLASCTDSLTLLLGLELQSFSVYVIAAQYKGYEPSEAAGLKYYLLGALSSAIVFMGLGVLYMSTGSTNFKFIAELGQVSNDPVKYLGYTLILIGFTWKIAAAPLHNWSVDVYDAVPSKSASWLSLVPKIAIITLIGCVFGASINGQIATDNEFTSESTSSFAASLLILLMFVSILSLIIGSIAGLTQPRIKRLLAYSGILNVGFILLSIALQSDSGSFNGQ